MATYRVQLDVEVVVDDIAAVERVAHGHTLDALVNSGGLAPSEVAATGHQAADGAAQEPVESLCMLVAGATHNGAQSTFPASARIVGMRFRPLP